MFTAGNIEKKILTASKNGKTFKLNTLLEKLKHYPVECLNKSLALASAYGHLEVMDVLLKYGADIEAEIEFFDDSGTPLFHAVENSQKKAVPFLIEKGANVNACTHKGWTPWMHSVDLLLDTYNQENFSSEQECRESACFQISQYLINAGADINAKNNEGKTALDMACDYNNHIIVKILQELGAKSGSID